MAELNIGFAAADAISFGALHDVTGWEACGAGGEVGHWAGTTVVGGAVAVGAAATAEIWMPATGAMLVGAGAGGLSSNLVSDFVLGQHVNVLDAGVSTSLGVLLGPAAYVGIFLKSEKVFDQWAVMPLFGPLGLGTAADGAISTSVKPSYGNGLRRKC